MPGRKRIPPNPHRSAGDVATSRRTVLAAALALPVAACAGGRTGTLAVAPTGSPAPADAAPTDAAPTDAAPTDAVPTVPPSAPAPGTAAAPPRRELDHATSGRPQVALTFHGAGDLDLARRVLTVLHDRGAAVTVLAVGTWLAQYPDAARVVTGLGHELGNHTWSHPDLAALAPAGVRTEIERCRDRIAAAIGGPGAFFRPSQAQHATPEIRAVAAAAGYPTVLSYDVDSRDFTDPGTAAVRRNVAAVRAGGVVSMHLGHPGTLAALPGVLDDLATRGLTPVTAGALFG